MFIQKFKLNAKKLIKIEETNIDGVVFNLHCKATAAMLFVACLVITLKEHVLKEGPIHCISGYTKKDEDRHKVIEKLCWINKTFILTPDNSTGKNILLTGLYRSNYKQEDIIYQKYYQWVCFVLFLQGVLFYAPKWFWKNSEGGLMNHLRSVDGRKLVSKKEKSIQKNILAKYFITRLKLHAGYTYTYWLYELLCLVNVVAQVFAVDLFLGGKNNFIYYGLRVYSEFPATKPMDYLFPTLTRCVYHDCGPSGTIQVRDALCVLVLNSYNRYIYLFMWHWFLILILLLIPLLISRILLMLSSQLRYAHLLTPGERKFAYEIKLVARRLPTSDWWVLYLLKCNVDPILFKKLILELAKRLANGNTERKESTD